MQSALLTLLSMGFLTNDYSWGGGNRVNVQCSFGVKSSFSAKCSFSVVPTFNNFAQVTGLQSVVDSEMNLQHH